MIGTTRCNKQKMTQILWKPAFPHHSQMTKFRLFINKTHNLNLAEYHDLHTWSINNFRDFWKGVWIFCGVRSSIGEAKWFVGARLNYAENLLFSDGGCGGRPALISTNEMCDYECVVGRAELVDAVHRLSDSLRAQGVGIGDRVVGYITNSQHAVISMLATIAIGAIWSSASPDFGIVGVLERFKQITPKILICSDCVLYNGKWHSQIEKINAIVQDLPSLVKVVVVATAAAGQTPCSMDQVLNIPNAISWESFAEIEPTSKTLAFEQLPLDHPISILYSSGTTGIPKCIVHGAGLLLQHKKELQIHGDLSSNDVFFYYTTTGWMMFNWLVSGLSVGATLLLYDGSPFKPSPNRLFDLASKYKVTVFGISAKYVQSLQAILHKPVGDFSSMRAILSTGSPLLPTSFDFLYENVKRDVLVGSITGGTDIASLFAGWNTSLDVIRGEIQCACLGMDIQGWNERGERVAEGCLGDLVCTKPFPCMPVYFWDDPLGQKYRDAYFGKFGGFVWNHGDFIQINANGGIVMLGRSDGTLNPGDKFDELEDSLVVGQKVKDDERVICFLKMKPGIVFTEELATRIKAEIRRLLSPRHVPSVILSIPDIPYTLTGKKLELAVKRVINGERPDVNDSSLRNPESLNHFKDIAQLKI